jgi:GMP synthase (glutamine-hydrolysing)
MRSLLISLRDPDDPMAEQELRCFVATTGLTALRKVHAINTPLDADLLASADVFFFGGSGAYSVLDTHAWVKNMLGFLCRVVDARKPAWASCFGFQGLSLALGGEVNRDDARQELGAFPIDRVSGVLDPVFDAAPPTFYAQLGHHDHVDVLPPGVTLLATGRAIHNQAFRVDGAPFWAAQFHPELRKSTTIERWNYYRSHYSGDPAAADRIDRVMMESPDTPEAEGIIRQFVKVAQEHVLGGGAR